MSFEASAIAFNHSRATGAAKLILLGIASHDGDGGAWPSMATLARYGNCTVRNAQRAVAKLVELGEIRVYQQQGGNAATPDHTRPNLYEFTLICSPDCDRSKQHRSRYELDPLTPTSPPDAHVTPPLTPTSPELPINHPSTKVSGKPTAVNARATVPPAPKLPRLADLPNPTKPALDPLTDAEQAAISALASVPCPQGFGDGKNRLHWFPPGLPGCARCGADALDLANELETA